MHRFAAVLFCSLAACGRIGYEPVDSANGGPGITRVDNGSGGVGRCDDLAPVRLYARNIYASSPSDGIHFLAKVANPTPLPIPLASLKVRSYFTNNLSSPWMTNVYSTDIGCSPPRKNFEATFFVSAQSMPVAPTADTYLVWLRRCRWLRRARRCRAGRSSLSRAV